MAFLTRRQAAALALSSCAMLSSCLSFNYVQTYFGEPIDQDSYSDLAVDRSNLTQCLETLGAPELVWTSEDGSVNLAWAWFDTTDWGLSASFSAERLVNVEFEFDSVDIAVESLVLQFDADLTLQRLSRGYLWDLAPSAQPGTAAARMLAQTPR